MLALLTALVVGSAAPADTTYLYRTLLIRAAPGQLLAVIELYRERRTAYEAAGDGTPFIIRHRQGDHWDLMVLFPMGSFTAYYAEGRVARRQQADAASGTTEDQFASRVAARVAWREETFMRGPPLEELRGRLDQGALYHIEMFIALPDKRAELFREREMENAFLAALDRPQNLLFTRAGGAAWDLMTLGVYRDLTHFAESDTIPAERENAAARAAGFEAADRIGTYLRTLLARHNDTLAGRVR